VEKGVFKAERFKAESRNEKAESGDPEKEPPGQAGNGKRSKNMSANYVNFYFVLGLSLDLSPRLLFNSTTLLLDGSSIMNNVECKM